MFPQAARSRLLATMLIVFCILSVPSIVTLSNNHLISSSQIPGPNPLARTKVLSSISRTAIAKSQEFSHTASFLEGANPRKLGSAQFSTPTMDEQIGLTISQDYSSIAYNVTAIEQAGPDGYGPAYLLNGLTNEGYWYQVGLAYDWPLAGGSFASGFSIAYEVFDNNGNSVFPTNGAGGLAFIDVNAGDTVLLSLFFSSGNVTMYAYDYNTTFSVSEGYSAVSANKFVGLNLPANSNGFFTGLMTEEYHASPYYGNEERATYSNPTPVGSGTMWIDEYNVSSGVSLFSGESGLVIYTQPNHLVRYQYEGAQAASNAYKFFSGTKPIVIIAFSYSTQDGSTPPVAPVLNYTYQGVAQSAILTTTPTPYTLDYETTWTLSSILSVNTAWFPNATSGVAVSNESYSVTYFHEYEVNFNYSVIGGGSGYSSPTATYSVQGTQTNASMGSRVWADANSAYSYESLLPSSSSNFERWFSNSTVGEITGPENVSVAYNNQYYVNVSTSQSIPSGIIFPSSGWFNSSSQISIIEGNYAGWLAKGWQGAGNGSYSGSSASTTISVDAPLNESAIYYPGVTLTAGNGGGILCTYGTTATTATLVPAGSTDTIYVPQGTMFGFSSVPSSFLYTFSGWQGISGLSSATNQSVNVSAPLHVSASYTYDYVNITAIIATFLIPAALVIVFVRRRGRTSQTYAPQN